MSIDMCSFVYFQSRPLPSVGQVRDAGSHAAQTQGFESSLHSLLSDDIATQYLRGLSHLQRYGIKIATFVTDVFTAHRF